MNQRQYSQVVRAVLARPWAIDEDSIEWSAILEVVAFREAGVALEAAEIQARIAAAAAGHGPRSGGQRSANVAVIPIYGTILPRAGLMSNFSGGSSAEGIAGDFEAAMADPGVDAIVLDIDSPGGQVQGIPELADRIRGARGTKPISAVANHSALSAAYWIASAADEIVATPSGEVGSIGVVTAHQELSAAQEKAGVRTTLLYRGKRKVEGNRFEPLTPEARASIEGDLDTFDRMFSAGVAKGRGVPIATVRGPAFGEGAHVLAQAALAAGMIDRVDTLEATIRRVGRAAITGDPLRSAQVSPGARADEPAVVVASGADPRDASADESALERVDASPAAAVDGSAEVALAPGGDTGADEGELPAGLPFAAEAERVLLELVALAARASEVSALRAHDGRALSASTRGRLAAVAEQAAVVAGVFAALGAEPVAGTVQTPPRARRDLEVFEAAYAGGYRLD